MRIERRDVQDVATLAFQAVCAWIVPERHWYPLCRRFARWEMRWQKDRVGRSCERIRGACRGQPIALDTREVEAERIAGRYYERLIIFGSYRPRGWRPRIELHGRERLDQALAGGRGAILWVSDFTASALVAKIALHSAGIAIAHLSRPTHGSSRTVFGIRFLNPLRSKLEGRYLQDRIVIDSDDQGRDAMRRLRSTLQENGVVSITVGAWAKRTQLVPLLSGRITYATGPTHLARVSGAPLLPVFTVRDEDGTFHVHIGSALELPVTDDQKEYERTLLHYVEQLEPFIRRYPGLWRTWPRVQPAEAWSVEESLGGGVRPEHGTAAMDAVADGQGGERQ